MALLRHLVTSPTLLRRGGVVDARRPNPDNLTRNYETTGTVARDARGRRLPARRDLDRMTAAREIVTDKRDQFAFHDDIVYLAETKRGLTRETVEEISRFKDEPEWMLKFRLRAFD